MSRPLSIPARPSLPRALSSAERAALRRVAGVLIPAHDDAPAAGDEAGYVDDLDRALLARAEAFDTIVAVVQRSAAVADGDLFGWLEQLATHEPDAFQAVSTVLAGAWLLNPAVRARLRYRGQATSRARVDEAFDELATGLLDPVITRGNDGRWLSLPDDDRPEEHR